MPKTLTEEQLAFFHENGYVKIENAVSPEDCQAVIDAVFTFLEMNPNAPEDWYRPPLSPGGMVEMYQHQALWNNRQNPRLYGAFADILGTDKLWTSIDRANLKPPVNEKYPKYDHHGFTHWDVDTSKLPLPLGVQGVLYLADTPEDMGGFQCVPGFHNDLEWWIPQQPEGRNPRAPDLSRLPENRKLVPITGKQGNFVIWNRLLAHGNGRNLSDKPRFAQYISMFRAPENDEPRRQDRIRRWKERIPLEADWVIGDPREWEPKHGKTAELTPLGRKLLGLDAWE